MLRNSRHIFCVLLQLWREFKPTNLLTMLCRLLPCPRKSFLFSMICRSYLLRLIQLTHRLLVKRWRLMLSRLLRMCRMQWGRPICYTSVLQLANRILLVLTRRSAWRIGLRECDSVSSAVEVSALNFTSPVGFFSIFFPAAASVWTTRVSTKERAAVVEWKLKGRIRENPTDEVYITSLVQTHHN